MREAVNACATDVVALDGPGAIEHEGVIGRTASEHGHRGGIIMSSRVRAIGLGLGVVYALAGLGSGPLAGERAREVEIKERLVSPMLSAMRKSFDENLRTYMSTVGKEMKGPEAAGLERDLRSALERYVRKAEVELSAELAAWHGVIWVATPGASKATVGWSVLELEPRRASGIDVPTTFRLTYVLDSKAFPTVDRLQAAVFSNREFRSPHITEILAEGSSPVGTTALELSFMITEPGTYHVVYGPRSGYFDPETKAQNPQHYRLSVTSEEGSVRWISYWLGDATIVRGAPNEVASNILYIAPDTVHDTTLLDLISIPQEARALLVERRVW